ncbi:integral membrane sensor signal transduction histidine kinase [Ktedonobacter racemifer DSM 44963]|uniref:histidine kinase n=2 Tax=Ktedonobacter racemifer TaxID=363277 RepID=D6TC15_KTERA|nr:integral membrane sensor signal transduction histidine kinase [Ktedonobacter racemifer DSM 44963]
MKSSLEDTDSETEMKLSSKQTHLIQRAQTCWQRMLAWPVEHAWVPRLWARTHDLVSPNWVLLHLIAVSISVSLLETLTGPASGLSAPTWQVLKWAPLPELSNALSSVSFLLLVFTTFCACLLYLLLISLRLHERRWRRWSFSVLLLALLLGGTSLIGLHVTLALQLRLGIQAYGLVAYARVSHGQRGGWITSSTIALGILVSMAFQEALLGNTSFSPTLLQYLVWLTGLVFIQTLCGLGVQERAARRQSEQLVRELTAAQEQLRAYAISAEELAMMRERARVAREIHDTLAQGFAAMSMHLDTSVVTFEGQPALALHHLERARELARAHLRESRSVILDLRSEALSGQSLTAALASLASAWRSEAPGGGQAVFHESAQVRALTPSPAVELACYRITQEALTNAARHGRATAVEIELSVEVQDLCLTITDNGDGFDPDTLSSDNSCGHFGIIGMRERLRLVHGRLDIISAPGAGTQVAAMIPVSEIQGAEVKGR